MMRRTATPQPATADARNQEFQAGGAVMKTIPHEPSCSLHSKDTNYHPTTGLVAARGFALNDGGGTIVLPTSSASA